MAYECAFDAEGREETAETSRACFQRLSNDLDQCAKEILCLSAALLHHEYEKASGGSLAPPDAFSEI